MPLPAWKLLGTFGGVVSTKTPTSGTALFTGVDAGSGGGCGAIAGASTPSSPEPGSLPPKLSTTAWKSSFGKSLGRGALPHFTISWLKFLTLKPSGSVRRALNSLKLRSMAQPACSPHAPGHRA